MQHQDEIRKKILGCWLGKTVGGVLGTPWESDPRTHALTWYDPMPDQALPNDDLELQVMYLDGLSRMKEPVVNRELLADLWIQHMNFHVQEYGVALCNLRRGIRPPWSGLLENHFVDGMGAAIGAALLEPNFTGLVGAEGTDFLGIPLQAVSYGSTIFPISASTASTSL